MRDNRDQFLTCWGDEIAAFVKVAGVNRALDLIAELNREDPAFASDCHTFAHRVGEEAYVFFERGKQFAVRETTGICNYGFYHGFMQEYTSHSKDKRKAFDFCAYIAKEAPKMVSVNLETLISQCYHGIGHGLTFLYATKVWGEDLQKTVKNAIAVCQEVGVEVRECVNGVFGGIDAMYWGLHGFRLTFSKDDPFSLCHNQQEEYQELCYNSLVPPVFHLAGSSITAAGPFITAIQNDRAARIAAEHLGSMPAHELIAKTNDYSTVIRECRVLGDTLGVYCIRGVAKALIYLGSGTEALGRAVPYCASALLSPDESERCREAIIEQLHYALTDRGVRDLCRDTREHIELAQFCEDYLTGI